MLAVVLQSLSVYIATCGGVLDVAPNRATTRVVEQIGPRRYVKLDFDPGADGRNVDVQASLESLPFPDCSFDVVIFYHVLEHVERDDVAMAELSRVLTSGGFALVQVPWRANSPTDEDPRASPSERISRFGQADHVRFYGSDFEERLCRHGLSGTRFLPSDLMAEDMTSALSVLPTEPVWFLRKGPGQNCHDAQELFALGLIQTGTAWRSVVTSRHQISTIGRWWLRGTSEEHSDTSQPANCRGAEGRDNMAAFGP